MLGRRFAPRIRGLKKQRIYRIDEGKDYGPAWAIKLISAKANAAEKCWEIVDRSLDIAGGFGIFPKSGLEKLFRDGRLGRLHPANRYLTREILGKAMLGVDLDGQPRWG